MANKRKIRYPHCGFLETIKKGKREGYSRYFCKNCSSYFTDRRPHISERIILAMQISLKPRIRLSRFSVI